MVFILLNCESSRNVTIRIENNNNNSNVKIKVQIIVVFSRHNRANLISISKENILSLNINLTLRRSKSIKAKLTGRIVNRSPLLQL